jgi:hypothetical protein
MQLMEDERSRRALESAQLRSEIIEELQQRERKFEADRARTQQEHFARGHDEGKDLGRKEARADFEVRMQELALEAQRAKTELDAFKDELRTAQDDATAEHRRLDAAISSLKRQVEEGTRNKASLEFQMQRAQVHVRGAEDKMILGVSALAHRLRRPIAPAELKDFVAKLRAGDIATTAAAEIIAGQEAQLDADADALRAQRNGWVSDELSAAYGETLAATYHAAFELPLQAAHAELVATIGRLLEERHAAEISEVVATEDAARRLVDSEQEADFAAIDGVRTAQREERAALEVEETAARAAVDADADEWVADAERHLAGQAAERADTEAAEARARLEVEDEERGGMKEIEEIVYAEAIAAQRAIIDEETVARGDGEVEQDVEFDTLSTAYGESLDQVRELQAARAQFEAALAVVIDGESAARAAIDTEAYDEMDAAGRDFRESMPQPPRAPTPTPPPTPPPPAPPAMPVVPAFGSESDSDAAPAVVAQAAASTSSTPRAPAVPEPAPAPVEEEEAAPTSAPAPVVPAPAAPLPLASDAAEAALDPLGGATVIASAANFDRGDITSVPQPKVAPKPAAKAAGKSLFAGSSDEDSDAAPARRPASPLAKKSVAPPAKPAMAKTALFGSSSDSDNEKPRPKPAAKAAAPKPAAKVAKLFGSDSD